MDVLPRKHVRDGALGRDILSVELTSRWSYCTRFCGCRFLGVIARILICQGRSFGASPEANNGDVDERRAAEFGEDQEHSNETERECDEDSKVLFRDYYLVVIDKMKNRLTLQR